MPRGLNLSHSLIAKMIPFVIICNFFKSEHIYIISFRVAHWDTIDFNAKGQMFLSVLMESVMCLDINMQEEEILEPHNENHQCGHFSQLVDHCVT